MPTKVKNKRVKLRGARGSKSVDLIAFEKELALETFVEIQLRGRQVGCAATERQQKVQIRFWV